MTTVPKVEIYDKLVNDLWAIETTFLDGAKKCYNVSAKYVQHLIDNGSELNDRTKSFAQGQVDAEKHTEIAKDALEHTSEEVCEIKPKVEDGLITTSTAGKIVTDEGAKKEEVVVPEIEPELDLKDEPTDEVDLNDIDETQ